MRTSLVTVAGCALVLAAGCACGPELAIREMRIEVEDAALPGPGRPRRWPVTTLDADGTIRTDGQLVGRIERDGTVRDHEGTVVARLASDGRVWIGDVPTDGVISADGTLTNGTDHTLVIESDGRVHGSHPEAPRLRITPASDEVRRTAMLVVVLGMLSDGSEHVSVGPLPRPRPPR
jgi:hypothetical protein